MKTIIKKSSLLGLALGIAIQNGHTMEQVNKLDINSSTSQENTVFFILNPDVMRCIFNFTNFQTQCQISQISKEIQDLAKRTWVYQTKGMDKILGIDINRNAYSFYLQCPLFSTKFDKLKFNYSILSNFLINTDKKLPLLTRTILVVNELTRQTVGVLENIEYAKNPANKQNLAGINLRWAYIRGIDLTNANLAGADLYNVNAYMVNLNGANLQFTNLQKANLQYAKLQSANLIGANLHWANLHWADLKGVNLSGANLQEVDLEKVNLEGANLVGANLKGANLHLANLREANLEEADLQGANLEGANLVRAILKRTKLQGANLERAQLQGANLQGANLQNAFLCYANLHLADLQYADLQGTNLQGAIGLGSGCTLF